MKIVSICCKERKQLMTVEFKAKGNHFIFYLTGDGGFTKSTKILCSLFQTHNINVISMNTHYFWGGKTLSQAVNAFEDVVTQIDQKTKIERITVIGYSFGADITPFIINNIYDSLRSRISNVVLLSPSKRTDLKISLKSLLFQKQAGKLDVVSEINKIALPVKILLNDHDSLSDSNFNEHIVVKRLPGNHHFDYKYDLLVKTILDEIE